MKNNKGFTLIELIVVMAVFLVIIGTALTIFISIVQHQRKILAQQELLNQVSYFLEYMGKGLRMAVKADSERCIEEGRVYELSNCNITTGTCSGIKFINASDNDTCYEFYLDNEDPAVIKEKKNNQNESVNNVTSTNLKINSLKFAIDDDNQPRVTIFLDVQSTKNANQPPIKVQTTVSQRNIR